jgi:hypothetical protein
MRCRRNGEAPAAGKFPVFGYLQGTRRAARLHYQGRQKHENKGVMGALGLDGSKRSRRNVRRATTKKLPAPILREG